MRTVIIGYLGMTAKVSHICVSCLAQFCLKIIQKEFTSGSVNIAEYLLHLWRAITIVNLGAPTGCMTSCVQQYFVVVPFVFV